MEQNKNTTIRRYTKEDAELLFALIMREGDEWKEYWGREGKPKYEKALASSITYLIFEDDVLCGYARCRDDDGFGIYVYDLLVDKAYRSKTYGRMLMEQVYCDYSGEAVYVMSDVDAYYKKLHYEKIGSIFAVGKSEETSS